MGLKNFNFILFKKDEMLIVLFSIIKNILKKNPKKSNFKGTTGGPGSSSTPGLYTVFH